MPQPVIPTKGFYYLNFLYKAGFVHVICSLVRGELLLGAVLLGVDVLDSLRVVGWELDVLDVFRVVGWELDVLDVLRVLDLAWELDVLDEPCWVGASDQRM